MQIVLAGVQPYDGAYDLDLDREFSTREWGWIKRLAGYLPLDVDDRTLGDPELACVLAVIAMHRAGRIQRSEVPGVFERLEDAPFGSAITVTVDPEPEEAANPTPPSSTGNGATSGPGSPTSSATPTASAGTPGSATSASAPAMSTT